jgi:hypothetical protein
LAEPAVEQAVLVLHKFQFLPQLALFGGVKVFVAYKQDQGRKKSRGHDEQNAVAHLYFPRAFHPLVGQAFGVVVILYLGHRGWIKFATVLKEARGCKVKLFQVMTQPPPPAKIVLESNLPYDDLG